MGRMDDALMTPPAGLRRGPRRNHDPEMGGANDTLRLENATPSKPAMGSLGTSASLRTPAAMISGTRCSTVGWLMAAPGALRCQSSKASTLLSVSVSRTQASKSEAQPGGFVAPRWGW